MVQYAHTFRCAVVVVFCKSMLDGDLQAFQCGVSVACWELVSSAGVSTHGQLLAATLRSSNEEQAFGKAQSHVLEMCSMIACLRFGLIAAILCALYAGEQESACRLVPDATLTTAGSEKQTSRSDTNQT